MRFVMRAMPVLMLPVIAKFPAVSTRYSFQHRNYRERLSLDRIQVLY